MADLVSPWSKALAIEWEDDWFVRKGSTRTVRALARFIADKLVQRATDKSEEQEVRQAAIAELRTLRDELDAMIERAEASGPGAEEAAARAAILEELAAPGPIWPALRGGGPVELQRSQERTASLRSYRFTAKSRRRNGLVVNGEFAKWGRDLPGSVAQAQRGQWNLRSEVTENHAAGVVPEGTPGSELSILTVFTPWVGWSYREQGLQAMVTRTDVADLLFELGVERIRRGLVHMRLEADPVAWLMLMDPQTAKVVESRDEEAPGGEPEALHIVEGHPVKWLLSNADKQDRDKLPIEPLLRITVGEDGFPRHVLVQRYAPWSAVLELTVTDYELNPDLPDGLFDFTPPKGRPIEESDPRYWRYLPVGDISSGDQ